MFYLFIYFWQVSWDTWEFPHRESGVFSPLSVIQNDHYCLHTQEELKLRDRFDELEQYYCEIVIYDEKSTPTHGRFRFASSDLNGYVRWSLGVPHIILHLFSLYENVHGFCSTKPHGTVRTSLVLWFAGSSVFSRVSLSFRTTFWVCFWNTVFC